MVPPLLHQKGYNDVIHLECMADLQLAIVVFIQFCYEYLLVYTYQCQAKEGRGGKRLPRIFLLPGKTQLVKNHWQLSIIIIIIIMLIIIKGTGVGQVGPQPTTGTWTTPPTRVQGDTFGKCSQPRSQPLSGLRQNIMI